MVEILLTIKDYITQRGVHTRIYRDKYFTSNTYPHSVDIEDDLDWMIYDESIMADIFNISLDAQYKKYTVTLSFVDHFDLSDTSDALIFAIKKNSTSLRYITSAQFDLSDPGCFQKIYEFIITKH